LVAGHGRVAVASRPATAPRPRRLRAQAGQVVVASVYPVAPAVVDAARAAEATAAGPPGEPAGPHAVAELVLGFAPNLRGSFGPAPHELLVLVAAGFAAFGNALKPVQVQLPLEGRQLVVPKMQWQHLHAHNQEWSAQEKYTQPQNGRENPHRTHTGIPNLSPKKERKMMQSESTKSRMVELEYFCN
jgi:hypothetical protein